jgi:hypothetical protein
VTDERGTGRTTRQMKHAPIGAIYVVPNHAGIAYFSALARDLRRNDLKIHTSFVIDEHRLAGLRCDIVVDHACLINGEQLDIILRHLDRVARYRRVAA